jgi:hypothetical protein
MLQDKRDVIIVKFLWLMKGIIALVAIDSYDVSLEVEKARKDTWNKLSPKIIH